MYHGCADFGNGTKISDEKWRLVKPKEQKMIKGCCKKH